MNQDSSYILKLRIAISWICLKPTNKGTLLQKLYFLKHLLVKFPRYHATQAETKSAS